jgi:hypothetical protein
MYKKINKNTFELNKEITEMDTVKFLDNLNTYPALNFKDYHKVNEDKDSITVILHGSSLNGSYIYENKMVATYIEKLKGIFKGKITYIGGENVYSYGKYKFKFSKEKWLVQGKEYSANGYSNIAFEFGIEFSILHAIYKEINNNATTFECIGIKLNNNIVSIDNIDIFKVNRYEAPINKHFKSNPNGGLGQDCNRTYFNASFESFIKNESDILKLYINIIKRVEKHNIKIQGYSHTLKNVYISYPHGYYPTIKIKTSDKDYNNEFIVGNNISVPLMSSEFE